MSKENKIEGIRKDIFAAFGGYAKWEEDWQSLAEAVYNAGYRKQSEVAREIFEEIEKEVLLSLPVSSYIDAPRTTQNKIWNTIAELKKKYTEEGK